MRSILIIDTPKSCNECEFRGYKSVNVQYTCCDRLDYCIHDNMLINGKFKNCPLQDTTELLEALESVSDYSNLYTMYLSETPQYNKLYKALGGKE